jgi:tetratricopeptide (TPR) repeat protein
MGADVIGPQLPLSDRNTMKRFIFPLAIGFCFLALVPHQTTVAAKDAWVSVRTKHFFIVGNGAEKEVRRVAVKLEQFREVFTRLFPAAKFNTPVPTTVIAFKSDSSYAPFKIRANNAGYFQPGPDVNYIALTTEAKGQEDPFSIIFHEYTHLLVENTFASAPVWFNEGLAEYYSSFSITDDQKIVVGNPISSHVYLLREKKMLPLKTLFDVDYKSPHYNETNKQSIFYAQSWALMHYLILGRPGKVDQLGKFMELLSLKVPKEQAFQQAFEVPFEVMERDLQNYIKQDRYPVVRGNFARRLELDSAIEVTPLSEAEVQAYLGDLLVHSNRKDAYAYLERALKLDPDLAMAHASLGLAYFREGKTKEAYASLERAVAANSQNYLAHYYYAYTLSRSGPNEGPIFAGYPAETAAKIREHVQKTIALRPDFPESYNLLAFVSLVTGQNIEEAIAALRKVLSSSPGRHEFMYMLGQLYLHKGDYKSARQMLEQVTKSNADEQVRQHSQSLLTQLNTVEQQQALYEAEKPAPGSQTEVTTYNAEAVQTSRAPQNDPSYYLREALRKPAAGETQLQGKLVKIDCEPKGLVFVVQTAAGLLRLRTTSFDAITLTTYDPKVNGELSCGPRKPENVLVVCFLPNKDKRLKIDGVLKSVEFVPEDFKLKPNAD